MWGESLQMIHEKNKGEYASPTPSISKINSTCSGPQLRIVSTMSAGYDHIGNKIKNQTKNETKGMSYQDQCKEVHIQRRMKSAVKKLFHPLSFSTVYSQDLIKF